MSKINPFDRDRPTDELVFFVTKQPINGELLLQNNSALNPATDFGYEVLSGDTDITLIYQHKGTETTKDQFELSVFDGVHTTEGMVNITIIPMDDEQPRLVVNTGLRIDRGQSKTITTRNLKAQDLDSEDSQLMYIVMMESISGKLQKLNTSQLYSDLVKGSNFTQTDIDRKRIRCEDFYSKYLINRECSCSFVRSFIRSCVPSFLPSFVLSFMCSFLLSLLHLAHLFIQVLAQSITFCLVRFSAILLFVWKTSKTGI